MGQLKITERKSGRVIFRRVREAATIAERSIGLMFAPSLGDDDGLLIRHCNAIHTCFMRFPIDVVFISRSGEVVKVIRAMKPWRFSLLYWRASQTLEVQGGTLPESITPGVHLEIEHV